MNVAVVGAGHVGLVTSACLASMGHDVVATDSDGEKIERLLRGEPTFFEPGLAELLAEGTAASRLRFTSHGREAFAGSEVVFICVGTPPDVDGEANLVAVERAAIEFARHGADDAVVVEKSTVPVGTAGRIAQTLARERPGAAFEVVSNPEFLREGRAIRDYLEPDRILVGSASQRGFD
ncbi:MAG: UDP-glucose/GDP-mannose dehydrogenase family protein, partial [Actinobacteria bacterium]|nr:UDP-glucose/GDP-mannose dehydrogenase family protein [Actinomycetota bacterium]